MKMLRDSQMDVHYQLASDFNQNDLIYLGRFLSDDDNFALLLSGSGYDSAENSFLCVFPYESLSILSVKEENPWDILKRQLHSIDQKHDLPEWVGYLTYEMGAYHDKEVVIPHFHCGYPKVYFQRYGLVIKLHHPSGLLTIRCHRDCPEEKLKQFADQSFWKENKKFSKFSPFPSKIKLIKAIECFETYTQKIQRAKQSIIAGDIYQINLSQELIYSGFCDSLNIFRKVFQENPAPFSAYLKMPGGHTIVCSSPERLLRLENGELETRPIKGTISRGKDVKEDELNRQLLLASEKERSELLMITDLMRNDIGKISQPGTVNTLKIWHCESYQNVFHLLSIIRSRILPSIHSIDGLRSIFPGGSITGCPKIRAMEIISEIEQSPRGVYTGSVGYFAGNGDFDFNIAIRTLNILDDQISLRLGGGIVFDSEPHLEYQEILSKGESIFKCLKTIL